jgi:hypothetical protein
MRSYVRELGGGLYEMKVDSENIVPSSVISSSPSFIFNVSLSWGEYCGELDMILFE